jgi:glycerophosphoryl diester phosphodiesterase
MFDEDRINITAHAGCMGIEMDSLEAVEAGIKYGADIIEIDLNIDENQTLVLCHDHILKDFLERK